MIRKLIKVPPNKLQNNQASYPKSNPPILADKSLLCNGIRNCKFGWDEETCSSGEGGGIPVDFSKTENIVIVLILIAIMIGMCTGMIYNLVRKLSEDKEDVLASREKVGVGKICLPNISSPATHLVQFSHIFHCLAI